MIKPAATPTASKNCSVLPRSASAAFSEPGARLGVLAGGEVGEAEVGGERVLQLLGDGERLARVRERRLGADQRACAPW
jgi:hypothetical protein